MASLLSMPYEEKSPKPEYSVYFAFVVRESLESTVTKCSPLNQKNEPINYWKKPPKLFTVDHRQEMPSSNWAAFCLRRIVHADAATCPIRL
jgi:hypothetical protein